MSDEVTNGYAQHLTPEAAAWIAERHNPKFKPKRGNPKSSKVPKLSAARYEKLMRENLRMFGTPRQIAAFEVEMTERQAQG